MLLRLLILMLLLVALGGGVYLWQSRSPSPFAGVAGNVGSALSSEFSTSLSKGVSGVAQTATQGLVLGLMKLPQAATAGGEKIPVDEAARSIQDQLGTLPNDIAVRARYEYCKQVVSDFESLPTPSPKP